MSNPEISPTPTVEEAVAVMAAVEALWPRPSLGVTEPESATAWRFGSRPWLRDPLTSRRHISRPWY
ncbi:MAG: hypothetical protein O2925_04990 [Actinomycetota bacterium]|nr:hypothetical protein [Actinomycetota bacterium]MDA3014503.1 hypothetical protein [Actinomycetota bacterium]MDA3028136.1 hypothetical protein [Actinomycetota bacterium]